MISKYEFKKAMEVFKAIKLSSHVDYIPERVPRYEVEGIVFSNYNGRAVEVEKYIQIPSEIWEKVSKELGEENHITNKHFEAGEIYTLECLFTVLAMLEDSYSKDVVDEFINKTYKKIFSCSLISENVELSERRYYNHTKDYTVEMNKKINKYLDYVNPFANCRVKYNEPIKYVEKIGLDITIEDTIRPFAMLKFRVNAIRENIQTLFINDYTGISYESWIINEFSKNKETSRIKFVQNRYGNEALVCMDLNFEPYNVKRKRVLKLSTHTVYDENDKRGHNLKEEEADFFVLALDRHINAIEKRIIKYMID